MDTYDLKTKVGQVRLLSGDNKVPEVVFSDEEIKYFLEVNKDCVYLASADLLEAWASKYGSSMDSEKIGDYSYTRKTIDNMLNLAKNLRDRSVEIFDWGVFGKDEL